ncbi:Dyp-type peroxidase [Tabrizicola sp. BL-A-41-H6]|uniref:Dyp-type peroxidase n=1 Tax=Tabrizicola sp. BL-A-41-H6 TaxID=3421107 RepID=UPI003D669482
MKQIEHSQLQGNILRGYRMDHVRHMFLQVTKPAAAREFLGVAANGGNADVPAIMVDQPHHTKWPEGKKPRFCFNIGVTFTGLKALGVADRDLATFPTEFRDGMAARATKLGDFGESAPQNWSAPFDQPDLIHVIASIYANDPVALDEVDAQVRRAFDVKGQRDGYALPEDKVYFGYRDSISQPKFTHVKGEVEPVDPYGTVLLGEPTRLEGLDFRIPSPTVLGHHGTFNAFRVLRQHVTAFEDYLDKAATELMAHPDSALLLPMDAQFGIGIEPLDRHGMLREVVAAQMCGRWRNGVPYGSSPDGMPDTEGLSLTEFDYTRQSRCPAGSHLRRTNPRGAPIVQRIANYTRRLVRRGMSYGPITNAGDSEPEVGLLGNFIGASLGAQFEAVMCDWLNLGLQDPDITGANDPLIGANTPETSWFDLTLSNGGTIRLRGFPRFVSTRGGVYAFLPSMPAIRYLAGLKP